MGTWLNPSIPDDAVSTEGLTRFQSVFLLVVNPGVAMCTFTLMTTGAKKLNWSQVTVQRLFYLAREFAVIITTVCIPISEILWKPQLSAPFHQ